MELNNWLDWTHLAQTRKESIDDGDWSDHYLTDLIEYAGPTISYSSGGRWPKRRFY